MTAPVLEATRAVVRVRDGRGFVVEGERSRLVITAAHCLPQFPPCAGFSHLEERTAGGSAENKGMSLDSDFHVEVVDDEIVVSLPRSSYSVTY
jgi:hypothetical protein